MESEKPRKINPQDDISRQLKKKIGIGIKSFTPVKQHRLTPKRKEKRLEFTRKHLYWTVDDLDKVQFSDESVLQQFRRHKHVRRPIGKGSDKKNIPSWPWNIHPVKWSAVLWAKKQICWITFSDTWRYHEWTQISRITEGKTPVAYGSRQYHYSHTW